MKPGLKLFIRCTVWAIFPAGSIFAAYGAKVFGISVGMSGFLSSTASFFTCVGIIFTGIFLLQETNR